MAAATNGQTKASDFGAELFKAADKMRGSVEPSEYKHIVLGLIFLKYVSDAFLAHHAKLATDKTSDPEDPDEYMAENVFWVPPDARWSNLKDHATSPNIGIMIDAAMDAIEKTPGNEKLKGALPRRYARPELDKAMLGALVNQFSNIGMHDEFDKARDLFGRAYEYCLSSFAANEGKRGGEFLTPPSVVRTLVDMLEPFQGRVYDPCCGTGGMFVQSMRFIADHARRAGQPEELEKRKVAVYGQERNDTTYRLAKMNLAVHGIDAEITWNHEGSFHRDAFPDLKADFILANPPFNISDWGGELLRDDVRWKFGAPPVSNANYGWLQHIIHHLAPRGTAGVVLANGSMSSQQSGEGEIRKALIEGDVVDCMVALPGQLFYSTQIPACLWILARNKSANGHRDRRGEFLFIDARKLGFMVDRVRREFAPDDIAKIAGAYHRWRAKPATLKKEKWQPYADEAGFCMSATLEMVREHGHVLTPGRYVGAADVEDDGVPFAEKFVGLREKLEVHFAGGRRWRSGLRRHSVRLRSMLDWPLMTLADAGVSLIDCVHATPKSMTSGFPYVAIPDLKDGHVNFATTRRITAEDFVAGTKKANPQLHDVILSRRTNPGVTAVDRSGSPFALGQNLVLLRANGSGVYAPFLRWLARGSEWWTHIQKFNNVGAVFDNLKCADVPKFQLTIPPKAHQRLIANFLDALDDKIELNRRMNETLEAMAQAIFRNWFVDFGLTRRKIAGVTNPIDIMGGLVQDPARAAELAELFPAVFSDNGLPDGWELGSLGDMAQQVGESVRPDKLAPETPYVGLEHMPRRSIALDNWEGAGKVTSGKLAFKRGDFLFGKLRPYFHKVGIAPLDGISSTDIVVLNARTEDARSFVISCISLPEFVAFTDQTSDGTKMPRTSWGRMARFEVCVPPATVLSAFEKATATMLERIVANVHESKTLAATRDLLLPKLLSGEIGLRDAEKLAEAAQ